jgi:hypothetical protein
MKKLLLSLVALLGVMNANAQVEETDRTGYPDVIYAQPLTVLKGTESAKLQINIKSHTNFQSVQFDLVLPDGASIVDLDGIEKSRKSYSPGHQGSEVYEYNDAGTVIATATCDYGFTAGDDVFSYITINVANLEAGEYPIIVKNATISGFITAEGVSTAEKDAFIADEITTILTVVDGVVLDENSTTAPVAVANTKVTVKRTINAGEWGTICLPFDMTEAQVQAAFGEGAQLADFNGTEITRDGDELVKAITVNFVSASSIQANHPYLIKATKDVTHDEGFKVENVTITPSTSLIVESDYNEEEDEYTSFFYGVYIPTTLTKLKFMFLSGNNFYYAKANTTQVKGFRGYFEFPALVNTKYRTITSAGVKMQVNVDGEPTRVNDLQIANTNEGVFTIDGKKLNSDVTKLPKGVYIIDGKKVAIK